MGGTESPALWHGGHWRHNETLGHPRVGQMCLLTQSVQHVVVDCQCVIHKTPDGCAGLRRLDAATRTWKQLNIDI